MHLNESYELKYLCILNIHSLLNGLKYDFTLSLFFPDVNVLCDLACGSIRVHS